MGALPGGRSAVFVDPATLDPRIVDWRVIGDAILVVRIRERDGRAGREVADRLAASETVGRIKWAAE